MMMRLINNSVSAAIKHARRVVITVVGFTVLLIGIVMIVLPGPAIIIIPLGLSILAGEFVWAKRYLEKAKRMAESILARRRPGNGNDKEKLS